MEKIIKDALWQDVRTLDREGIEYDILKIKPMKGYDVYEIKISGDKLYIDMALHAIRRLYAQ